MTSVFRWGYGHVSAATLQADTSSLVANWTWNGRDWRVNPTAVIDKAAGSVVTLGYNKVQYGGISLKVYIEVLDTDMWQYIMTAYFPSGVASAPQTLQVYDIDEDDWKVIQCIGHRPLVTMADLQPRAGKLLRPVAFDFVKGEYV